MDLLTEHGALTSWGDAIEEDSQDGPAAPTTAAGAPLPPAEQAVLDQLAGDSRQGLNLMFKQVRWLGGGVLVHPRGDKCGPPPPRPARDPRGANR